MSTPQGEPAGVSLDRAVSRWAAVLALRAVPMGLLGAGGKRPSVHQQAGSQPNILFVLLDDLRADDLGEI